MFLEGSASIGYRYTRKKVIALVQKVVDEKGRNVVVTSGWWEGFCKRHTHLPLRCAEHNGLAAKPCQNFHCDKTRMPLDPKPPKVIVHRGIKHPRAITSGDKTQITVLACCNTAGYVMPPFVIFDGKSIKPEMCDGEIPGMMYGMSNSGWIKGELFYQRTTSYHMPQPLDFSTYCWAAIRLTLPHLVLGKQLRNKLLSSAYHLTPPMKPSLWTKDHLVL